MKINNAEISSLESLSSGNIIECYNDKKSDADYFILVFSQKYYGWILIDKYADGQYGDTFNSINDLISFLKHMYKHVAKK